MAGSAKLSRRKIAAYCADELLAGRSVTAKLAAYLSTTARTREAGLIVHDIEAALADKGVLVADIEGARELDPEARSAIVNYLKDVTKVSDVKLRETTDPTLLGGVRIAAAGQELDATLKHRLTQLKASKI